MIVLLFLKPIVYFFILLNKYIPTPSQFPVPPLLPVPFPKSPLLQTHYSYPPQKSRTHNRD